MCISIHSTKTFYFFFRKLYQCPSRKLVNQSARWTIAAEYFKVPPHGRGEIGAIFTTNQLLRHFCWHSNPFSHVPDGCRHFKFNRIGFDGLLARFFLVGGKIWKFLAGAGWGGGLEANVELWWDRPSTVGIIRTLLLFMDNRLVFFWHFHLFACRTRFRELAGPRGKIIGMLRNFHRISTYFIPIDSSL